MYRKLIPLALALVLLIGAFPQTAAAYNLSGGHWTGQTITGPNNYVFVCFKDFPGGDYGHKADLWMNAVNNWNDETANLRYIEAPNRDCDPADPNDYQIVWGCVSPFQCPNIAFTGDYTWKTSTTYNRAVTYINPTLFGDESKVWWHTTDQSCANFMTDTGSDCLIDAVAVAEHEAGHALGLAHMPSDTYARNCDPGYWYTDTVAACEPQNNGYGNVIMYPAAADGYKRRITYDDQAGAASIYNWPN